MKQACTNICNAEAGEDLQELKNAMFWCLENRQNRNNEVYGIFNGQLYVAYKWARCVGDIQEY